MGALHTINDFRRCLWQLAQSRGVLSVQGTAGFKAVKFAGLPDKFDDEAALVLSAQTNFT